MGWGGWVDRSLEGREVSMMTIMSKGGWVGRRPLSPVGIMNWIPMIKDRKGCSVLLPPHHYHHHLSPPPGGLSWRDCMTHECVS